MPLRYRILAEAEHELLPRRLTSRPSAIFAAIVRDPLVVFAVSHHERAPDYWARRLAKLGP